MGRLVREQFVPVETAVEQLIEAVGELSAKIPLAKTKALREAALAADQACTDFYQAVKNVKEEVG